MNMTKFKQLLDTVPDDFLYKNYSEIRHYLQDRVRAIGEVKSKERDKTSKKRQKAKLARDAQVTEWAKANLRVGDCVKVVGNANTPYRKIEQITRTGFRARHIYPPRQMGWTKEFNGDYITHHLFDKVTAIKVGEDFISIMKHIN